MRIDSANFTSADSADEKKPRYVAEIDFGSGNKKYLTSHSDCETPSGTAAADIIHGALTHFTALSQDIDPLNARSSIGTMRLEVTDLSRAVSQAIQTQRAAGRGEQLKPVTLYVGYRGLAWADYAQVQAQLFENIVGGKGRYTINCTDIQREARKKICVVKKTTLTSSITAAATTVTVANASEFEMVYHGTSYSDAPSSMVGYIRIEDEIIRYTGIISNTSPESTLNTFTGCTRGVLNTKAVEHIVDSGAGSDQKLEVKEHVYLELPGPKAALALYGNSLYGDSASIPDHWGLGITSTYLATSQFVAIGSDLWDAPDLSASPVGGDDTKGLIVRISGIEDVDGKQYIEEKLLRPLGLYPIINIDGQLGIKRVNAVLADASYIEVLDETNIVDFGELDHGKDVCNRYFIHWNYNETKKENTRHHLLIDADSAAVAKHGPREIKDMDFGVLHGSRATLSTIKNTFNALRDRYASPPLRLRVTCKHRMNRLDVGDVVRVNLTNLLRDLADTTLEFNRSMEIQKKSVDWFTGHVVFDLFGSAERAGVIVDSGSATVLSASDYSTGHTALTTALTSAGITYTDSGGILTITGSGTLTGNASLVSGGNYYYLGDLVVNSGVTLTITQNVALWIQGFVTNNGTINGKGQGIAASASGTAGVLGATKATGGVNWYSGRYSHADSVEKAVAAPDSGLDLASFQITYDSDGLHGLPTDLRGASGGTGGDIVHVGVGTQATGGAGGDGAASLSIVCQGIAAGVSSDIDLSGEDGTLGGSWAIGSKVLHAGRGAGGAPSGLFILMDGSSASETDILDHFTCNQGSSVTPGVPLNGAIDNKFASDSHAKVNHSFFEGFPADSHAESNLRVAYIHDLRDAEEDVAAETSLPSAITIQEGAATKSGLNVVPLEISVTPPSDGNYYGSRIMAALDTTDAWADIGVARSTDELVYFVPADGSTYNVRAYPISISGVESRDYIEDSHTVTAALKTVIATNNTIQTSSTVGEATSGQGIRQSATALEGYDSTGNLKFKLDASTGRMQCVDADVSGTMTSSLASSSTFVTSGGFLTTAASGGDGTLYLNDTSDFAASGSGQIVGATNDRDAFSWTGKTATTLTGCSGVLANPIGSVVIPLSTGAKSMMINYATNETRFYGDRGDGTVEELAAIGINTNGSDSVVGLFGSDSGSVVGVLGKSSTSSGVVGNSGTGTGVYGYSSGNHGVKALSQGGSGYAGVYGDGQIGVWGYSETGVGVRGQSTDDIGLTAETASTEMGAFKIVPKSNTTDPGTGGRGQFYVRSDGVLMFHDGTSWKTVTVT